MVAANGAGKTSRHADNHKLAFGEYAKYNRDKDTECTPRGAGSERNKASAQKYDSGQHHLKSLCGARHDTVNVVAYAKGVGHVFKAGCKGKDKYSGNHRDKALGNAAHSVLEVNKAAAHHVNGDKNKRNYAAPRQSDGSVGVSKGVDKVHVSKGVAVTDIKKSKNAGNDKDNNRQNKVDNLALR